jgi:hypothetical protein
MILQQCDWKGSEFSWIKKQLQKVTALFLITNPLVEKRSFRHFPVTADNSGSEEHGFPGHVGFSRCQARSPHSIDYGHVRQNRIQKPYRHEGQKKRGAQRTHRHPARTR